MSKWISVDKKLPHNRVLVEVKRDFSVGTGGSSGKLEWVSRGYYIRVGHGKPNWSIKSTEGLTLNNSKPTHWRVVEYGV